MAKCFRDELLHLIPEGEIRAIYLKGSAVKAWESPLDYVPEISDVDMHVWFRDDPSWSRYLGTVSQAPGGAEGRGGPVRREGTRGPSTSRGHSSS